MFHITSFVYGHKLTEIKINERRRHSYANINSQIMLPVYSYIKSYLAGTTAFCECHFIFASNFIKLTYKFEYFIIIQHF